MASLRRLDASHNVLLSLDGCGGLDKLALLVVGHNQVSSLAPLQDKQHLRQLDASHNAIENRREVCPAGPP